MKVKTVLKLQDLYKLDSELNGITNPENNELLINGLLAEEVPFVTKFWLNKLVETVSQEKQSLEKSREELIKKHGKLDEQGNIFIPMYINEVTDEETKEIVSREVNPGFIAFQNEFNTLLNEDFELEHKEFHLEDFKEVKSKNNYQIFYKLIKIDE